MLHVKIESALTDIAKRFEFREGLPIYRCQTGEEYVTLVAGGIKQQGAEFPCWFASGDDALAGWLASFEEYARGKSGALYWRSRLEISCEASDADDGNLRWQAFSRLVITDKPEVPYRLVHRIEYEFD